MRASAEPVAAADDRRCQRRLARAGLGAGERRQRCGFTLVELLVVMTIIAVLMMLSLPVVQGVRESARKVQCGNNLKQLGLAITQYESVHEVFPASGINNPPVSRYYEARSGRMFSWLVLILPQLEQEGLHSQFDFERSVLQQPKEPQATPLASLLCPSDSARGMFYTDPALTGGKRFAKGNYAAFVSPFHTDLQLYFPGALVATGQKTALIVDGLSNTLMLSEVRIRNHPQDQRGAWALPWTGASTLAFDMHHDFVVPFNAPYAASPFSIGLTQPPNNRGPNVDMLYQCPDMADAQLQNMPCAQWEDHGVWNFLSAAPRSQHPGGVNVAFADGRVAFLPNEVDEVAMAYLVSINDGRPVNAAELVR